MQLQKNIEKNYQLGENPKKVFNVGGLGIDNILRLKLLEKKELEKELNLKFAKKNLMITFHPVTLEKGSSKKYMNEILEALKEFNEPNLIFTVPNADMDGRIIISMIEEYANTNTSRVKIYKSLGQLNYLSCLKYVDAILGNSSSGIMEARVLK